MPKPPVNPWRLKTVLTGLHPQGSLRDLTPTEYINDVVPPPRNKMDQQIDLRLQLLGLAAADHYGVDDDGNPDHLMRDMTKKLSPEVPGAVRVLYGSRPGDHGGFIPSEQKIRIDPNIPIWARVGALYHETQHAKEGMLRLPRNQNSSAPGLEDIRPEEIDRNSAGHFKRTNPALNYDFPMEQLHTEHTLMGQRVPEEARARYKNSLPVNPWSLPMGGGKAGENLGDVEDAILRILAK